MGLSQQSSRQTFGRVEISLFLLLVVWLAWQLWGLEVIWRPWEDETDFVLPGANWARTGHFCLPQWQGLFGSETVWRWHMPLFPLLIALWLKVFGTSLVSIRLFTLIPAACAIVLASEFCLRISDWRSVSARLFWWALLLSDKTLIVNALGGRMEFHALCFILLSFAAAFTVRSAGQFFIAGLFLGIAIGFHPFAAYFYPALCAVAFMRFSIWKIRWRSTIFAGIGAAIPGVAYAIWFLLEPSASASQFLTLVRNSSTPILENCKGLARGVHHLPPAQRLAGLLAIGLAAISLRTSQARKNVAKILLVALAGYVAFLLRGSAEHYYYYVPLTVLLYLFCAYSLSSLQIAGFNAGRVVLAVLLLNNIVFVGVKSRAVWQNRAKSDPRPMEAYLREQLKGAQRVVVPPKLWLFAFHEKLNFRLMQTPISDFPAAVWVDYRAGLLKWRPEVVVISNQPWPSLTAEDLLLAGYKETGHYDRTFAHQFKFKGYKLRIFRSTRGL